MRDDGTLIDRQTTLRVSPLSLCYQTRSRVIIPPVAALTTRGERHHVVFRRDGEKIREGTFRGGTLADVVVSILSRGSPGFLRRERYLAAKSRSLHERALALIASRNRKGSRKGSGRTAGL